MCLQSGERRSGFFLLREMFNWLRILFPAICVVFCIFTYWGNLGGPCSQTEEAGSHAPFPGLHAHVHQPFSHASSQSSLVTLDLETGSEGWAASPRCAHSSQGGRAFSGPGLTALPWASLGTLLLFSPGLSAPTEDSG